MTKKDTLQDLAARIANVLDAEASSTDIASLFGSIEKINHRLDKLERSTKTAMVQPSPAAPHPSLDKLNIAEAIADSIFGAQFKEKACQFEPGKPCDHCSMCNSRGF